MNPFNYLEYLFSPMHALRLSLTRRLKWSRGRPPLMQELKSDLFSYLENPEERRKAEIRHQELFQRYQMGPLHSRSSLQVYLDNIYLLDVLENLCPQDNRENKENKGNKITALDIGPRNWDYLYALAAFLLSRQGRQDLEIHGVEVDPYGIYPDFYSRYDYAKAYMEQVQGHPLWQKKIQTLHYHTGDFLQVPLPSMDWIFLFYPFLSKGPLLKWGLPLGLFQPQKLLDRALNLLRPGGFLVILNQTSEEKEHLIRYFEEKSARGQGEWKILVSRPLKGRLVPYLDRIQDRQGTVLAKVKSGGF